MQPGNASDLRFLRIRRRSVILMADSGKGNAAASAVPRLPTPVTYVTMLPIYHMITVDQAHELYTDDDPVHDFDHILRVLALAEHIGAAEGADMEVLRAAALLHDVGRDEAEASGQDHAQFAAAQARQILDSAPPAKVEAVVQAILAHRFRSGPPPESLEGRVLFDADKLDAIGAIGVARAFAYSGRAGKRLWAPVTDDYLDRWRRGLVESDEHTAAHEFAVKLSRLRERLFTSEGRRIAEERHAVMARFFERLADEVTGQS
jgi:uncharacterized protein